MFKGKNIILGVTSSIAAYKSANVASALVKKGCNVNVLMTENATNFINPLTFEELTKHKCIIDTFDRNVQYNVAHISLAVSADAFIIAPASANVIGKIANGIADDMLTTTVMACKCPVIISPAMNTNMYENLIVQDNIAKLERFGYIIVPPAEGRLACGTIGKGKMPDEQVLLDYLERALSDKQDFKGKRVLVTAGPTQESIDPVRYITNHSSGKMGYAVARQAMLRGAEVTLVSGKVNLPPVPFVKMIYITTAEDMYNAVTAEFENTDIVIKAAAVADFRPKRIADDKLKKADGMDSIELEPTKDILKELGKNKKNRFICGFSMETKNMTENSRKKLENKNLDMIVCNNLKVEGAGFQGDTNVVTVIDKTNITELGIMSKTEVADKILDRIAEINK
ncbi:bifunctional phosphopantothenoylcysteine decarboxylase/phosphopantothenate--cysteine ligase CoaBC [Ruminococcus bromii]|uniref:Coenzyme A biosynthesis bifunctional protein CoaBC n=1 Tax=Ruminococcus bromii TaxID=40518 RepID=A0ABT0NIM9_9FIRM|nr:bifunctional phosphopantothenoylcysteine decarboxylase/phosphopantothenate--cysteine ligase CoaBC [Ruminococcus bromii]MCL3788113.1 bifunctional phosphopantothenoylcysteine decarboxylase/phosphopantothenate--cysteine ligase CoaBC [Ruminococcus bromii]MDR3971046.1 bifunctional phosphopantothenoylcysteine decarboxylase/phosphopantothenate--cysteine ligase CoaBC [Ruminococcus sp.]